jgi:hypothetical protein
MKRLDVIKLFHETEIRAGNEAGSQASQGPAGCGHEAGADLDSRHWLGRLSA